VDSVLCIIRYGDLSLNEIAKYFDAPEFIKTRHQNCKIIHDLYEKKVDDSVVTFHQILRIHSANFEITTIFLSNHNNIFLN
jgi:hypothetical protein